jgi:hypothetical protein
MFMYEAECELETLIIETEMLTLKFILEQLKNESISKHDFERYQTILFKYLERGSQ